MKKWIFTFVLLVVLFTGLVYYFLPAELIVSSATTISCTRDASYRLLSTQSNWKKWWPSDDGQDKTNRDQSEKKNSADLQLIKQLNNGVDILINDGRFSSPGTINLIPLGLDSVVLTWTCHIISGWSPLQRISNYREAVSVKKIMDIRISKLKQFLENAENVYEMPIERSSTTDTLLIATKYNTTAYPTTAQVYHSINGLLKYIASQKTTQSGFPMLNVTRLSTHLFQTMVAIPTSKMVAAKDSFFVRRLIHGSFMVSKITGGNYTVDRAVTQMQLYFNDYKKTSVAIPFQSLVTDRSAEPDTSKWVTVIFAPVM